METCRRLTTTTTILSLCLLAVSIIRVECLGVNWGTIAIHRLPPQTVVQMLKDNGIGKVKLFDADRNVLKALAGSGIEVMVAVPNEMLEAMNNYDKAVEWVKKNVTAYHFNGGVDIRYVAIGNEPFLTAYNGTYLKTTFPALQNVQRALNEAGLGDIVKATVPFNADVYDSPVDNPVPSAGRFRSDVIEQMQLIVDFLAENKAPFSVNIYPFLSLYLSANFPMDYAFFDGASPLIDNGTKYTNVFDANFDTLVSALKAIGHEDMPIFVGEVGWPTDGDKNANLAYAIRFYNGLMKKLSTNQGTPRRPGYIEVYLFGLLDEDAKSILPGNFERHWGLFRYDGQPKFPIDLSGKGDNQSLVPAQNVTYQPLTWCMLDPEAKDMSKLDDNVDYACTRADCTALAPGSSCSGLDAHASASYAFNSYYQIQNQNPQSCNFQGLAKITTSNISQANCNFTIQIVYSSSTTVWPSLKITALVLASIILLI
ncbi:hypothetical protein MLD38_033258 [Melastoma candidum]|uniref:Uncharacterized protein n=1 Tax=Melastoma candidum TaxID=119954 RepID=A0ACB9M659_9MYRT|nr:hypothetical protein MLD38_033258 [Melastoma candidum]